MESAVKSRVFGFKKSTLIANAASFIILILIIYPFHYKPIKNQLVATYKVAEMAHRLQQEGRAAFAMEANLQNRSLSQAYKCIDACDSSLSTFSDLLNMSQIEIPYSGFERNSWGYVLAASNYVLTGANEPKLVDPADMNLDLTRERTESIKSKIFFNLFK